MPRKLNTEEFIKIGNAVHGDFYSYRETEYLTAKDNVTIVCPAHGKFSIRANNHLSGSGCKECARSRVSREKTLTTPDFINKAVAVHGHKYDYSKTIYVQSKQKVSITCASHGSFSQYPSDHLSGHGCPKCYIKPKLQKTKPDRIEKIAKPKVSRPSGEDIPDNSHELATKLYDFLTGADTSHKLVLENVRNYVFIRNKNILIRVNSLWHSGEFNGFHRYKFLNLKKGAEQRGYSFLPLYEDELNGDNWDKTINRILHIINLDMDKYKDYARNTKVREVSPEEAKEYVDKIHSQNSGIKPEVAYGLFNKNGKLVSLMTFGPARFEKNKEIKQGSVELLRFVVTGSIVGGFSKLLKHYIQSNPGVKKIISYADSRWSKGNVYKKNGFSFMGHTPPGYFWCKGDGKRYSRQRFQKGGLKYLFDNFDPKLTEAQNCHNNGMWRIYDCGNSKWEYTINEKRT